MSIPEEHTVNIPYKTAAILLYAPTILQHTQEAVRSFMWTQSEKQETEKFIEETIRRCVASNEHVIALIPRSPTEPGDIFRPEGAPTDTDIVIAHNDWSVVASMCEWEGYTFECERRGMTQYSYGEVTITLLNYPPHTIVRVNASEIIDKNLRIAVCHYLLLQIAVGWLDYHDTYRDSGTLLAAANPQPAQIADKSGTAPKKTRKPGAGAKHAMPLSEREALCREYLASNLTQDAFCSNEEIDRSLLGRYLKEFYVKHGKKP